MKAHRRWLSGHEVKTIGYLNNDDAYNAGTEAGWRAALEWAKRETIPQDERGEISRIVINREIYGER